MSLKKVVNRLHLTYWIVGSIIFAAILAYATYFCWWLLPLLILFVVFKVKDIRYLWIKSKENV